MYDNILIDIGLFSYLILGLFLVEYLTHVLFCFVARITGKKVCKCWDCKEKCNLYSVKNNKVE